MIGNIREKKFDYQGERYKVLDLGYDQVPKGFLACKNLNTAQVLILYEYEVEDLINSTLFDEDEL